MQKVDTITSNDIALLLDERDNRFNRAPLSRSQEQDKKNFEQEF
jgi:hypothetical protein